MSFHSFKTKYIGKRVDTDGYPKGAVYQCVDLTKQYLIEEFKMKNQSYGDAKNWWLNTHPDILAKFNKKATPKVGDIVPLKPINGNPYGHIGIVDSFNGVNVVVLEQNGSTGSGNGLGGNAIRLRAIPRTRAYGYLSPKESGHKYAGLVGRNINLTDAFRAWERNTDRVKPNKLKGPYTVRDISVRKNRVVVSSASNGGLVDLALDDLNGNRYSGWQEI